MFKTKNKLLFVVLLFMISFGNAFSAVPNTLDSIKMALKGASDSLVQEKVYVHIDNTCYFVGDTIWYKAYVVRADNLKFTDMSRILYVELLSPDGVVVERQQLIVSPNGYGYGDFALKDSLYSGFYEIRAYTRWMLNFNVTEHPYARKDREAFFNFQMAKDYFRQYDALYSRVIPVYSKPDTAYEIRPKRMYERPKQRLEQLPADNLQVKFYPEGGHLISGMPARIAFEVTNRQGMDVNIAGTVSAEKEKKIASIKTSYMGRGVFTVNVPDDRMKASFNYKGKEYSFNLPKPENAGAAIQLSPDKKLSIQYRGAGGSDSFAISILCRGSLKLFRKIGLKNRGTVTFDVPERDLPTGINDLTLFDSHGHILADRLFFVNHHDYDVNSIKIGGLKEHYEPYEKVSLSVNCVKATSPVHFSLAVRDNISDDLSYNDGNILTDILLSSELKGFIAYPKYYFESDDAIHKKALDLLMMVQGWRRYNWVELADTTYQHPRYKPEKTMTVEGGVYKMIGINEITQDELPSWLNGSASGGGEEDELLANKNSTDNDVMPGTPLSENLSSGDISVNDNNDNHASSNTSDNSNTPKTASNNVKITEADNYIGINNTGLKKEVMVSSEMAIDTMTASAEQMTKNGHFVFQIPPYYGNSFFFLRAYDPDKSEKKLLNIQNKGKLDESAYPEFYVKRDLFFPVFARKYSYYENHFPEWQVPVYTSDSTSMDKKEHLLKNVTVKGKRRGKRSIDYSKPAWVGDAYDVYNNVTDYGLSFGKLNFRQFPYQICCWLYGNMGRYQSFNVDARMDKYLFYRSYSPMIETHVQSKSDFALFKDLRLKRLDVIRIYTDYEPRNEDAPMTMSKSSSDFTVDFITLPDDGERYTYRDRRYFLPGFFDAADYYSPDYSKSPLPDKKDYRRTLYWNPNVKTDANGNYTATFYNNGRKTELKCSAEGVTPDGKIIVGGN